MPFVSEAQRRACYAHRRQFGSKSGWNCEEWSAHTPKNRKLPEYVNQRKYGRQRTAGADDVITAAADVPATAIDVAADAVDVPVAAVDDVTTAAVSDVDMAADAARRSSAILTQPPSYSDVYGQPVPYGYYGYPAYQQPQPVPQIVDTAVSVPVVTSFPTTAVEQVVVQQPDTSASAAVAWFFIILFVLVLLALILFWIITVICPRKRCDFDARDVNARDICASHNVAVGCNLTVGGTSRTASEVAEALTLPPVRVDTVAVALDGSTTTTILTSTATTAVTVTLPLAADFPGLVVLLLNASAIGTFSVEPASTDTIDGSTSAVVGTQAAMFVSAGLSASAGVGDWKRIS